MTEHKNKTILLKQIGDSYEREGWELGLADKFPMYAGFWAQYVVPNREHRLRHKLRKGFPKQLEKLFNTHYGVWYHLTIAYRQSEHLEEGTVDISDPFVHLATAIDLIENVFVQASLIKAKIEEEQPMVALSKEDLDEKVNQYWQKTYQKHFKNFEGSLRSVNIRLHSVERLFDAIIIHSESRLKYQTTRQSIREYRNLLAHNLPPLKLKTGGATQIPRPKHLSRYRNALWSSENENLNPDHYAPAKDILQDIADDLTQAANGIWPTLLQMMNLIAISEPFKDELMGTPESSAQYPQPYEQYLKNHIVNHGGTINWYELSENSGSEHASGYVYPDEE